MEERIVAMVRDFKAKVARMGVSAVGQLKLPERKPEMPVITDKIRASKLGDCPVDIVLYMNGRVPRFDQATLKAFSEGTAIHRLFQKLEESRFDSIENYFETEHLTGHVDGIVGDSIVEIKSAAASRMPTADTIDKRYLYQVGAYFELTGLSRAYFIFINKRDLQDVRVFLFLRTPEISEMVKEKIELVMHLNEKFRSGLLTVEEMERVAHLDRCAFCGMKGECAVVEKRFSAKVDELENFLLGNGGPSL